MFDNTITMGNILQIIFMSLGGLYFIWIMDKKISILAVNYSNFAERLTKIDVEIQSLSKITIEIARQDERMTAQDKRLQELSTRIDDLSKLTKLLLPPGRIRRSKDL